MRTAAARRRRAVLTALVALALPGCAVQVPVHADGIVDLRADFETGDASQFTALECADPARQLQVVDEPVRQGRYAARFETAPGDTWSNGTVRCLAARYDSDEGQGDDRYFALSMYFPQVPSDTTVWELHNRREIYAVDPDTSVVPHALVTSGGALRYRLLTGPAAWDGTSWTGWSHYEPGIPLLPRIPVGRWIDVVVHVRFDHGDGGLLEVWARVDGASWPREPQIRRDGVPTLQWIPGTDTQVLGHPNDPRIPRDIRTRSLYVEMGLYPGTDAVAGTDVVVLDGYRRGTSLSSVLAGFP